MLPTAHLTGALLAHGVAAVVRVCAELAQLPAVHTLLAHVRQAVHAVPAVDVVAVSPRHQ